MIDENEKRVKDEPSHQSLSLSSKNNQAGQNGNHNEKANYPDKGLPLTFQ